MARFDRKIYRAGYGNGSDGATLGLNDENRTIKYCSGSTHPRAQHSAVSRGLMVRMLPGMLDGLCLSESTDRQDTEHKKNRQNFKEALAHRQATDNIFNVMLME